MDRDAIQVWEVVGTWFSGFATFLAVVLALFLQRFRRPRLSVRYEASYSGDNRYVPSHRLGNHGNREELWVRLRVKNTTRATAEDTELRLISMRRERQESEDRSSRWLKVSHLDKIAISIPPEFTQYFDLAYIINEHDSSNDISLEIAALNPPFLAWDEQKLINEQSGINNLKIGFKYDIVFAIVSRNADATYYKVGLKALPRENVDPLSTHGELYLRGRVELSKPERLLASQAFSL